MKRQYFKTAGISFLIMLVFAIATAVTITKKGNDKGSDRTELAQGKKYVCSMHPQVIRDEPGDCPICGMFLIEMVAQDQNSFDSSLVGIVRCVNSTVLGSVKNVFPVTDTLPVVIEAPGIINYDPRRVQSISARFAGYIEKTFVKYQFQHIKKGQKIYEIFSPEVYTERWNYVRLIQTYPDRDDLTVEALEWFRLLGLSKGQVDSIKRTTIPDYHLPVYSYAEGYAVSTDFDPENFFINGFSNSRNSGALLAGTGNIGLNDGLTVETGTPLFKLIDVRALRVDLKVKSEFTPLLREGQQVMLTDAAYPEKQFKAYIGQIEPLNGGLFQTVKVYLRDEEQLLLPGRQIEARIITGSREGLWVPATAVVDLGQSSSVFVLEDNKYIAREVRTGIRAKDKTEILYGVDENTLIAEKALLLVDSDGFINAN